MKHEGDTVTLRVTKTEHNLTDYLWTFDHQNSSIEIINVTRGNVIRVNGTRFGNRIQTHIETGSITISNLTVKDTGIFQFIAGAGFITKTFNLTVSGE